MGAAIPLAGGLLGGGAGLGGLGTVLQVGLGVASALQQKRAGESEASFITAEAEANVAQANLERLGEKTEAARDAAERKRRLTQTIREQNAIFGASGASGGSQLALQNRTFSDATAEIEAGQRASELRQGALFEQAKNFRRFGEVQASATKRAARTSAFGGLLDTVSSVAGRGFTPSSGGSSIKSLGRGIRRTGR